MRSAHLMSVKRLSIYALTLLPLGSGAWAADATPEGAQALEKQVQDWITGTLGPTVKIASRPVQATPEGDHYAIVVPLGDAPDAPRLTATARSSDNGRWNIDNIRLPSPTEFKINMPQPGDNSGGGATVPVTYKLTFGQQAAQILYDPKDTSPSTFTASFQNMDMTANGEGLQQSSHVDRSATTSTLRPASNGRVDLLTDTTMEGYRIDTKMADAEQLNLTFGRVRLNGEIDGVSRDRSVQVLQALIQVGAAMGTGGKADATPAPKPDEKAIRTLLEALGDLATGLSVEESVERLTVDYGGMAGSLNAFRLSFGGKANGGLLNARMELGAEGLTLPELGLGDMVQLIPSKVTLRPFVSGVATDDLIRLAKASENGGSPGPDDIQALFSHGGITTGLESFAIDVAGAGFTGMGKVVMTSPEVFSATAQITATNLDLLQQRVASNPQLAQALPVFIVAKGIGRAAGNQMVWDVVYQNGKLLVNNQDLSALAGGAPPAQQPAPKPPARPQGQQRPQQRR
jgi:hypothetical protein